MTATRQLIWLGPICFYVLRTCGRPGAFAVPRRFTVPAIVAGVAAIVAWLAFLGPAPPEGDLLTQAVAYAAAHPPCAGRVADTPGPGSYMLWVNPNVRTLTDGRIEAYSAGQIDGSYAVVNGGPGFRRLIRRWDVTGVVTRNQTGIRRLEAAGFEPVYQGGQGTYLVSRACLASEPDQK
jgi:hypothetical protein